MNKTITKKRTYKKRVKKPVTGDRYENTVQCAVNDHLKRKGIKFLRFPDWFWFWFNKESNASIGKKKQMSEMFAGWPDNMPFISISEKYHLCVMIENKSRKGRLTGKQRGMEKILNYQIPRSAEEGIKIINQFESDASILKILIYKNIGIEPSLQGDGTYHCGNSCEETVYSGEDYYCCVCGTKILW